MVFGAEFCFKKRIFVRSNNKALLLVKNKNKPSRGAVLKSMLSLIKLTLRTAEQESINARRQENDNRSAQELAVKGWK